MSVVLRSYMTGANAVAQRVSLKSVKHAKLIMDFIPDEMKDMEELEEDVEVPLGSTDEDVALVADYFRLWETTGGYKELPVPISSNKMEDMVGEVYAKFVDYDMFRVREIALAGNYVGSNSLLMLCIYKFGTAILGKDVGEALKPFGVTRMRDEEVRLVKKNERYKFIFDIKIDLEDKGGSDEEEGA